MSEQDEHTTYDVLINQLEKIEAENEQLKAEISKGAAEIELLKIKLLKIESEKIPVNRITAVPHTWADEQVTPESKEK